MTLWIGRDVEEFAARAEAFVAAAIERNVLATLLNGVREGRYAEAICATIEDERQQTVAAAIRTPPQHIVAAGRIDDPGALIAAWLADDPDPSGVSGEPELARRLAEAWTASSGGHTETDVREALHVLTEVIWPANLAPGRFRPADWREVAQLGEWGAAFATDAGIRHPEMMRAGVGHSVDQGRLYVWDLDGQIVSMVGHNVNVAGTVRVGPVYTPKQLRGHGYGTAATAALSQHLLDTGAERCTLFTDLANPISNHIYAKIGYRRIADWEELSFSSAPA